MDALPIKNFENAEHVHALDWLLDIVANEVKWATGWGDGESMPTVIPEHDDDGASLPSFVLRQGDETFRVTVAHVRSEPF